MVFVVVVVAAAFVCLFVLVFLGVWALFWM